MKRNLGVYLRVNPANPLGDLYVGEGNEDREKSQELEANTNGGSSDEHICLIDGLTEPQARYGESIVMHFFSKCDVGCVNR